MVTLPDGNLLDAVTVDVQQAQMIHDFALSRKCAARKRCGMVGCSLRVLCLLVTSSLVICCLALACLPAVR